MAHAFLEHRVPFLRFALLALFMLGCPACARPAQGGGAATSAGDFPRAGEPDAEEQACSRDVECALVDDCCGCERGGLRTGVRGDRRDALVERSAAACEQRTCNEQPSQHRSCSASAARCVGGRCLPAL
jgi:hypothetical protein